MLEPCKRCFNTFMANAYGTLEAVDCHIHSMSEINSGQDKIVRTDCRRENILHSSKLHSYQRCYIHTSIAWKGRKNTNRLQYTFKNGLLINWSCEPCNAKPSKSRKIRRNSSVSSADRGESRQKQQYTRRTTIPTHQQKCRGRYQ